MRISDWSSDVCSSDLDDGQEVLQNIAAVGIHVLDRQLSCRCHHQIETHVAVHVAQDRHVVHADRHEDMQPRSEEHTSELQSLMRISYAVFCLKKKNSIRTIITSMRPDQRLR